MRPVLLFCIPLPGKHASRGPAGQEACPSAVITHDWPAADSVNRQQASAVAGETVAGPNGRYSIWWTPKDTEWAAGAAFTATAGAPEAARIAPAAPSASMAVVRARFMRTIPPWHLYWSAACCTTHLTRRRR
jgi:hypothetical protein